MKWLSYEPTTGGTFYKTNFEEEARAVEGFINNQDVRVSIYSRCEREPDIHTARVGADWMLNKFTDPSEFNDIFKAFLNLFF